jgi:hypothetical protein
MSINDVKLVLRAYFDVNKMVRETFANTDEAVKYAKTDRYFQDIVNRYTYLKYLKPKIEKRK